MTGNEHYIPTLRLAVRHSAHGGHGTLGVHKVVLIEDFGVVLGIGWGHRAPRNLQGLGIRV